MALVSESAGSRVCASRTNSRAHMPPRPRTSPIKGHVFGAAGDRGDGHASAEGLGHGDQIRRDAEMFGSEPFAGAGEAGLHFVGDEENAVLATDALQQLEIAGRRNDEAAFAENGLGDHGGDGFGSHRTLESVFEVM